MRSVLRNIALSSVMAAALGATGCASWNDVQTAQASANSAQASANTAQATANNAQASANAAQATANHAMTVASNAHKGSGTYGGHSKKHHQGERADAGKHVIKAAGIQ